jgi:hypothetical protein
MAAKKTAAKKTAAKPKADVSVGKGKSVEVKATPVASDKDTIAAGNAVARSRRDDSGLGQLDRDSVTAYNVEKNTAAGRAGTAAAKEDAAKYFGEVYVQKKGKATGAKKILKGRSEKNAKIAEAIGSAADISNRPEATKAQTEQLNSATRGAGADPVKKQQVFNKVSTVNFGTNHHVPCTTDGCRNLVAPTFGDSVCPTCANDPADKAKWEAFGKKSGLSGAPSTAQPKD